MHSSCGLIIWAPFLFGQARREKIWQCVRAITAGMVLTVYMPISALSAELTDKDTARLTELVRQDCGSCHGLTLKGGLGQPLLPTDLEHYEVSVLADIILHGIPQTAMPGWNRIISRYEAEWIADALKKGKIAQ